MTLKQLSEKFGDISDTFAHETQFMLSSSHCDEDTRIALDELSRQIFYALTETQDTLINYLKSQN